MKRNQFLLLPLLLIIIVVAVSCQKGVKITMRDTVTGSWKIKSLAYDANKNGILDASEYYTDTGVNGFVYTYYSNGTGATKYYSKASGNFSWTLDTTNTWLQIYDPVNGKRSGSLHIDKSTSISMTLRDTSGSATSWEVFEKQ